MPFRELKTPVRESKAHFQRETFYFVIVVPSGNHMAGVIAALHKCVGAAALFLQL